MTALNMFKDLVFGLARGFGIFLNERGNHVETVYRPAVLRRR